MHEPGRVLLLALQQATYTGLAVVPVKKAPSVKSGLLHPPILVCCYPLWANTVGQGLGERRGGDLTWDGDGASGPVA